MKEVPSPLSLEELSAYTSKDSGVCSTGKSQHMFDCVRRLGNYCYLNRYAIYDVARVEHNMAS